MRKIVLTGLIGCGKSSTLENIKCNFEYNSSKKIVVVLENVEDCGWLLNKTYNSPKEYTTLLQVKILDHFLDVARKIDEYEQMPEGKRPDCLMMERAPLDVIKVFIEVAKPNIPREEYESLKVLVEKINQMPQWQNLEYILLDIPVDTCYERKNRRARKGEELIGKDYLNSLAMLYENYPYDHRIQITGKLHINAVADVVCRKVFGFGFDEGSPYPVRPQM